MNCRTHRSLTPRTHIAVGSTLPTTSVSGSDYHQSHCFAVRVGRHSEDNNLLCRLKSRPGGSTSANDESQTSLSRSGQQSAGTGASLLPPDGCGLAFKRVGGRQTSRFQISLSRTLLLTNVPALAGIISLPSSRTVSRKFLQTSFSRPRT